MTQLEVIAKQKVEVRRGVKVPVKPPCNGQIYRHDYRKVQSSDDKISGPHTSKNPKESLKRKNFPVPKIVEIFTDEAGATFPHDIREPNKPVEVGAIVRAVDNYADIKGNDDPDEFALGDIHLMITPTAEYIKRTGKMPKSPVGLPTGVLRTYAHAGAEFIREIRKMGGRKAVFGENGDIDTSVKYIHFHALGLFNEPKMHLLDELPSLDPDSERVRRFKRMYDDGNVAGIVAVMHAHNHMLASKNGIGQYFLGEPEVYRNGSLTQRLSKNGSELLDDESAPEMLKEIDRTMSLGCDTAEIPLDQRCRAFAITQDFDNSPEKDVTRLAIGAAYLDPHHQNHKAPVHGLGETLNHYIIKGDEDLSEETINKVNARHQPVMDSMASAVQKKIFGEHSITTIGNKWVAEFDKLAA